MLVQDILADHLDSETEEQSAIVTLLNIVGQVCLQSLVAQLLKPLIAHH